MSSIKIIFGHASPSNTRRRFLNFELLIIIKKTTKKKREQLSQKDSQKIQKDQEHDRNNKNHNGKRLEEAIKYSKTSL